MSTSSILEPGQVHLPEGTGSAGLVQEIVEVFQAAQDSAREPDLADFLLDNKHPLYPAVLHELILLDLRMRWRNGRPRRLAYYQQRFPEAFIDPHRLRELVQYEYQLRQKAGGNPLFEEYRQQFGNGALAMSELPRTLHATIRSDQLAIEAEDQRLGGSHDHFEDWQVGGSLALPGEEHFPQIGEEFLGFDLLALVGQGSFARVYLARQPQLNGRFVILKVSQEKAAEADVLAQLLHANIVPIYSFHSAGPLHAACMPFLGTTTLADVLSELRNRGLPQSGKNFVETLREHSTRSSSLHHGSSRETYFSTPTPVDASLADDPLLVEPKTRLILDSLERLSYPEAVLWMAGQLADGLAHAHERGILHRDLKPANILLTNEGQPMLLDFNLAEDTKLRTCEATRLGGTLLYMSPEQLGSFGGLKGPLDGRSDIWSLGIILYELLTGRFPFPYHDGPLKKILPKMLKDRQDGPPRFPPRCPGVTPALAAIIRKCLEPDPQRRYHSARELEEDIQRQLRHQPLRYARERSLIECFAKWRRRHPRLTSLTTALCLGTVLVVGMGSLVYARGERLKQYDAITTFYRFEETWTDAQFLLTSSFADELEVQQFVEKGRQSLQSYNVLAAADWRAQPAVQYLPREQQDYLERDIAATLLLLAQARTVEAAQLTGDDRSAKLQQALDFNARAERAGATTHLPRALWTQRAAVLALLGDQDRATQARRQATAPENADLAESPQNSHDIYLLAREHLLHGQPRKALPLLQEAIKKEPKNVPMWFLRGRCHEDLHEDKDAIVAYTTCIALRPHTPQSYFRRGLVYLNQKDYARAQSDFTKVIELEPKNSDAFFNRALARKGLGQPQKAIEDLNEAIDIGTPWTRVWFLRSRLRREAGDIAGARTDQQEGMKQTPRDIQSWIARGIARLDDDPKGALTDFEYALHLNPRSLPAMMNIAHVRAHVQHNTKDALDMLNRLIETYPNYTSALSARGVLLAKLGRRDDALKDAQTCLKGNPDAATLYRLAAIYAQTSRFEADDTDLALGLLRKALQQGYGHAHLDRDPTLAPLRQTPEYRSLVAAVRELRKK